MAAEKKWMYDEFKQIGTDYASMEEVEAYDQRMQKLRDVQKENESILNRLNVSPKHTAIEIGTGTAEFAIVAATRCSKVYALDVSKQMLNYAKQKAASRGISNIEFINAGFLSYEHAGEPVDFVVSQLALHHLPDFWKAIALRRVWSLLKDGGRFFLRDVVFSFRIENHEKVLDNWSFGAKQIGGEELAENIERHIRDEYSTYDWAMEGLIRSAGFTIQNTDYTNGVFAEYLCRRS